MDTLEFDDVSQAEQAGLDRTIATTPAPRYPRAPVVTSDRSHVHDAIVAPSRSGPCSRSTACADRGRAVGVIAGGHRGGRATVQSAR